MRRGASLLALLLAALAARAAPPSWSDLSANDTVAVTVAAGPVLVMEAPADDAATQTALIAQTPSLAGLVGTVEAALTAEGDADDAVSARGRAVRDLAGLLRGAAHRFIRSLGHELRGLAEASPGPPAGRRKKNDAWPMLGVGLIMGGTMLTIGLGALAAMSGKALMSSMLALGMSLMSALRPARRCRRSNQGGMNNGCGDDSDNYEIIARPVITHGHTHSAVLHHEPGMGVGVGPYPGYVRSLVQADPTDQLLSYEAPPSTSVDVTDYARSGATRGSRLAGSSSAAVADLEESASSPSWPGGVIGMRGPQAPPPPLTPVALATWAQGPDPGQAKHRGVFGSTQPRALGPATTATTTASTATAETPGG